uniref:Uncharacterized protein n=1 Tax=Kalanchoe fedtschenkoi TaxID=63787 RepID=A0A7N0V3B5_KALFE
MASFFSSLGGGGSGGVRDEQDEEQDQQQPPPAAANSLFLYRSEEIYKQQQGLEIWQQQQFYRQQQQQQQQYQPRDQHHHHHHIISYAPAAAPPPSLMAPSSSRRLSFNVSSDASSSRSGGGGFTVMRGIGGSGGGINCQDCGNQAKKDCPHLRCRTCCKSRGLQCQTHIKSTWVPASKRRERQQQLAALQQSQQLRLRSQDITLKRPRGELTTTNTTSGLDLSNTFPNEVNSQAIFRCVRVSSMDPEHNADEEHGRHEDQLAYQTAVSIGGHVFKGILYDQGPESRYGESSSVGSGAYQQQQQQLNLITSGATTTGAMTTSIAATQALLDASLNYPTPINAFMAGTQFFPPSRS